MHCPKCGRFMRRVGFSMSSTHWVCGNDGWGFTVKDKAQKPLFSRDALILVMNDTYRKEGSNELAT